MEGSLKSLKQQELIRLWHERDIQPGAIIELELQKHLQTAQVFLLLISANFLNLDFCYSKEMQDLMQRHEAGKIHIIPILLRETLWDETPFGGLRALPDNGQAVSSWRNKDGAFLNIAKGVRKIIDGFISSTPTHQVESTESQPTAKERADPSSQPRVHQSPSSFIDGQQHTAKDESAPMRPRTEQVYDGGVNYWGVFVGVGEYEDTSYLSLPVCVDDAKAVAKQLTRCGIEASPGSKGTPRPMPPAFIERVFDQAQGLTILSSCDAGENSYVWAAKKRSVFTYYLLEALQGGVADFNGKDRISASDLYKYVFDKVQRWAMLNNFSQNPRITADGQGDIVIAYYRQESTPPATTTTGDPAVAIASPRMSALSWKDIQEITIQGEVYVLEAATVRERPTGDDGTTLREARAQHRRTDLPLWLKQVHIVGPDRDGMKLQQILKKERQYLIDLENEGRRDFPRVFPLIESETETDFTFAYILTNDKSLLQAFAGSKGLLDESSIKQLLQSMLPLCEALGILHKKGWSHRALSPDALSLFKGRYAMLQNIGLAAWKPKKGEHSGWYLAPEQDEKNSDIEVRPGPATDIYQLGTILYFLITGRTFSPGSLPIFYNRAISSQLNETISRAIARQPIERWPNIEAFSAALRQAI